MTNEPTPRTDAAWLPISTALKDGRLIEGKRGDTIRLTSWGKASHVPLYGWMWGDDIEDIDLWEPTHWRATETGGGG